MSGLLIVDDDPLALRLACAVLGPMDLPTETAANRAEALAKAVVMRPDVVVLDVCLPDGGGVDVLGELLAIDPDLSVVMLTAEAEVPTAVRALQRGALDYLLKPMDQDALIHAVARGLARREPPSVLADAMGPSDEIAALAAHVEHVARSGRNVLVLGETGSGKELVARAIHDAGPDANHELVTIDCGALSESELGSLPSQGTLFLDEVGSLTASSQGMLLRVLHDRRVIAATNDELETRAHAGLFRLDLYFRLAELTAHVPPLRERKADIPYLAERFRRETASELGRSVLGFDDAAMERLREQPWRGNVRELRNVVQQAVLGCRGGVIAGSWLASLLPRASGRATARRSLKAVVDAAAEAAERDLLVDTLNATDGNRAEAARRLKVDAKTLYRKLKRYGINA